MFSLVSFFVLLLCLVSFWCGGVSAAVTATLSFYGQSDCASTPTFTQTNIVILPTRISACFNVTGILNLESAYVSCGSDNAASSLTAFRDNECVYPLASTQQAPLNGSCTNLPSSLFPSGATSATVKCSNDASKTRSQLSSCVLMLVLSLLVSLLS